MDQRSEITKKHRLTLENGDVYEGSVKPKKNKKGAGEYLVPHGYGIYYYTSENKRYEGNFNQGKKDGEGFFIYEEDDATKEDAVYVDGKLISSSILLTNKDVERAILSKLSIFSNIKEAAIVSFVDSKKFSDKINVVIEGDGLSYLLLTDKLLAQTLSSNLSLLKKYREKFSSFEDFDGEKIWVIDLQNLTKEQDKRFLKLINDKISNSKIEIPDQDLQDSYLALLQSISVDIDIVEKEAASASYDQQPKIDVSILEGNTALNVREDKREKFHIFASALENIAPRMVISFQDIIFEPAANGQNWLVKIPKKYLNSAMLSKYSRDVGYDQQYRKIPFQYIRDREEFKEIRSAILGDEIFSSSDIRKRIDSAWNSLKNSEKESVLIGEKKFSLNISANDIDRLYNTYSIDGKDMQYSIEFFGLLGKILETAARSENKLDNLHPLEIALERLRPAEISFLYDISINRVLVDKEKKEDTGKKEKEKIEGKKEKEKIEGKKEKEEKWFVTIPKEHLDSKVVIDNQKILIDRKSHWQIPLSHVINPNNKEFNLIAKVILGDDVFNDNFSSQINEYKDELRQQDRILKNKDHGEYFKVGEQNFYFGRANEKYSAGITIKMMESALIGGVTAVSRNFSEDNSSSKKTSAKKMRAKEKKYNNPFEWVEEFARGWQGDKQQEEDRAKIRAELAAEKIREEEKLLRQEEADLAAAIEMSLATSVGAPKKTVVSPTAEVVNLEKQEGRKK